MVLTRHDANPVRLWGAPTLEVDRWTATATTSTSAVDAPWMLTTAVFSSVTPDDWQEAAHVDHELLWSTTGNVTVEAAGQLWLVPPVLGIWLPAGVPHRVRADSGSVTYATYVSAAGAAQTPDSIAGVPMTGALRELILHNHYGEMSDDERMRLQHVVVDLIKPVQTASLDIPMPTAPALRAIADAIIADPSDDRTVEVWASTMNVGGRTLMRHFKDDTGMSLTQWRILIRIRVALIELAAGRPVVAVAKSLGYANPSTFIELFKNTTGHTPAAYFRSLGEAVAPEVGGKAQQAVTKP